MKTTKKFLAIILAILMVISIIPITASAATYSGTCGENITWEFDGATGILTISGTGNMYDYLKNNRPKYETYKSQIETVIINDGVNQIGTCAFYQYENLKNVTISDSVKTIETSAFYGCTNLASITIPDSVTSIGYNVFNNTAYYNNESNWESNVLYIGNHLYQAKYTIVGNYIIRNGTKTIADSAFSGCDELTNITIPDSVITIGADAFFNCDSLITVQIPHSVVTICEEVFALCDNLQSIIVDVNNQYYSNDEFGVLFNKDKSTLIQYPGGNKQINYLIPDTVSEIVEWAFGHAYDLESITIPDSVTKIGEYAFYYCSSLTKVKIGNGLTDTGNWVFGKCDSLVTVTIPDNITRIGDYAFYQCDNLTNVIIGKNLTSIGWAAFHECANIRDFYYSGTQNQWNTIAIDGCNDGLIYATIHYNSTGPHTHDYESAITPPTCTEQGYTTYTCECGDTYIDDYVEPTGHSHTSEITTPATHTTTGVMTYTCVCGDTYTEVITKLEKHNYESVVTAPTCTEQGYTTYTCECGDSYINDYVDALGHTEEIIPTVAPACTETGLTVGTECSVCGETLTEQEIIPANGHTPAATVEENYVAPTCTEKGSKDVVIYCLVCDEEISRETVVINATGHADNDGDGYCDADNELLDPSVECDHNCHKNGISGFIWKIINFFNKLFGLNKTCSCGVAHY